MRIMGMIIVVGILCQCVFGAIEAPEIELTNPVTYNPDGKVYIKRDSNDEMLFNDDSITSAVRLNTLVTAGGVTNHGDLTGLGNDDHSAIYYNSDRIYTKFGSSESGSGAVYIGSLPISGAVGDADTIGEFVADDEIHYKRAGRSAVVAKVNGQFSNIQDGIDWIVSEYGTNGGVVQINPGIYTEQITMAQNVSLRAEPGVILQYGVAGNYCLTVPGTAANCEIRGIKMESTNSTGKCQAILIVSGGDLTMRDCVIDWDSSVANEFALYVSGDIVAYDCQAICWDIVLYAAQSVEWNGGKIINTATSAGTTPIFIEDGGTGIFRDLVIDAGGAESGIFGSTAAIGYLYDVTILDAVTDLNGAFGTTFYTAGARYSTIGDEVTVNEIPEGRAENIRHYVQKTAGAIDDAYRYRMDDVARFRVDYEGNIFAAGDLQAANFTGGGSGVVSVAKEGGDYQTIQDAVDGITTGVILIYPGIYEEEITIDKSYITLIGWDKTKCIIRGTPAGAKRDLVRVYNTGGPINNITIANLTIYNTQTWGGGGSAAQEALDFGDPSGGAYAVTDCRVYNCILKGYQDTIFCYPNSEVIWENCYIWGGFDIASCWNTEAEFHNCHFHSMHTSGASIGYQTGGIVIVDGSLFTSEIVGTSGAWDLQSSSLTLYFYNNTYGDGIDRGIYFDTVGGTVYAGGNFGQALEPAGVTWGKTGGGVLQGDVEITGDTIITGTIDIINTSDFWDDVIINVGSAFKIIGNEGNYQLRWNPVGFPGLEFSNNQGTTWNTNLFQGGDNLLETEDDFSALSVQTNSTIWQYFSIMSAGGNIAAYDVQDGGPTPYIATGWMLNAVTAPIYANTVNDAACAYFPINYLPGTVLSRVRVKWQAEGANDGVKLRIVKRDESGTDTGWTVVGAQQTYTDPSAPFDVTPSTYDFTDETMSANYVYAIEVESEVVTTSARLYGVGIESNKRIY